MLSTLLLLAASGTCFVASLQHLQLFSERKEKMKEGVRVAKFCAGK